MEGRLKAARILATLMDSQFKIAGVRFGLDPILGLIPFVGDFLALILSFYIIYLTREFKVSAWDKFRIYLNLAIDFLLKLIPILGEVFDVVFKANLRNIQILEKYTGKLKTKDHVVEGQLLA